MERHNSELSRFGFFFWVFFALCIPDFYLEKLATQKHKWAPEKKKSQRKACSPYPKGASQQDRNSSENTILLQLNISEKNVSPPPILLPPAKAKCLLRLPPLSGWKARNEAPTLPPKLCQRICTWEQIFMLGPTPTPTPSWQCQWGGWTSKPTFISPHYVCHRKPRGKSGLSSLPIGKKDTLVPMVLKEVTWGAVTRHSGPSKPGQYHRRLSKNPELPPTPSSVEEQLPYMCLWGTWTSTPSWQ